MMIHEPVCTGYKVCKICGENKHVLAYLSNPECADGLSGHCRDCEGEKRKKRPTAKAQHDARVEHRIALLKMYSSVEAGYKS